MGGLAMKYLIDGYNLLFAYLGTQPSRKLSKALERARRRLLELLRLAHDGQLNEVTVIFDAAHAPPGIPDQFDHHGIQVVFAIHEERADDLIEKMIRSASAPRQLTVVSDDHRIQQAARRRHCAVHGCGDYLNSLERRNSNNSAEAPAEESKPQAASEQETQHWLEEFADLQRDPALKELADPYGFEAENEPGAG
jgi:predicted RNA-binding protein with PIN domain